MRQNGDNNSIDIKNSTENNLDGTVDANLTAPDLSSTPLTGSGIGNSQSTPVPEPLTILGSIAALGFGGFLERKLGKNQKDEK